MMRKQPQPYWSTETTQDINTNDLIDCLQELELDSSDLMAACASTFGNIESHPEFDRLLNSFNLPYYQEEIYGGDVSSYDAWGVPCGDWSVPLEWNGGELPLPDQETTSLVSSDGRVDSSPDHADNMDRLAEFITWLDLTPSETGNAMEGDPGPGHEDSNFAELVQRREPETWGGEGDLEESMELLGPGPTTPGTHHAGQKPAHGADTMLQAGASQTQEESQIQTETPRSSKSQRRQLRREKARARRRVSFGQNAEGLGLHDNATPAKKRVRDDTPRPKPPTKRQKEERTGPRVEYKDPSTGRILTYSVSSNRYSPKGYYTSGYKQRGRK